MYRGNSGGTARSCPPFCKEINPCDPLLAWALVVAVYKKRVELKTYKGIINRLFWFLFVFCLFFFVLFFVVFQNFQESRSNAEDFFKDPNSPCPQEAIMQEPDAPFLRGGPGLYKVVKTGPSGHNVRSCPNLRGIPIGMLVLGNRVKAVGEVGLSWNFPSYLHRYWLANQMSLSKNCSLSQPLLFLPRDAEG